MAQASTIKLGKSALLLGDGASPEAFTAPCGLEQLTMTVNIETTNTPDCSDPDLPSWLVSDEVSKQMTISGEGVLDTTAMQTWRDWFMGGGEKNVRWFTDLAAGSGGGHYEAPAILTTYEEQGQRGQRWRVSIGVALNGKPIFTAAS